ncbi:Fibronectin domain-containing protein [Apostichopus japonicus]|uniref:Fibronectin domain-containing protein n=1 Tax=Stichopus japonicus TaxID=307972 RepID=A0A2G8LMZ3_STIJA|nr:Fibronectin domain-containing protein [Apostichopus japonicus]
MVPINTDGRQHSGKVFVFQIPAHLGKRVFNRTMFGRSGIVRVQTAPRAYPVTKETASCLNRGTNRSQATHCREGISTHICPLNSSKAYCRLLDNIDSSCITLNLSTKSDRLGYSSVAADWTICNSSSTVHVVNQTITYQLLDNGNCTNGTTTFPRAVGNVTRFDRKRKFKAYSLVKVTLTVQTKTKNLTKYDEIRSKSTAPTGEPTNIEATRDRRLNTLSFSWEDPICKKRNGNITHFSYVLYRSNSRIVKNDDVVNGTRTVKFNGLSRSERFSFDVRAHTDSGPGPYSDPYEGFF